MSPRQVISEHRPSSVRVTLADGSQLTGRHPVMSDSALVWTDWTREVPWVRVPLSEVTSMEFRRSEPGRTLGLIVLTAPVAYFAVFIYLRLSYPVTDEP